MYNPYICTYICTILVYVLKFMKRKPLIDPDRTQALQFNKVELPRFMLVGKSPQSKETKFLGIKFN